MEERGQTMRPNFFLIVSTNIILLFESWIWDGANKIGRAAHTVSEEE